MKFSRRRSPIVATTLLFGALVAVGGVYAVATSVQPANAAVSAGSETQVEQGHRLYLEGCSSCHGMAAQGSQNGPTLVGVGAAAVDFQVGSGRMPMGAPGAQAPAIDPPRYDDDQISSMAAYVASLAPGPAIPTAEQYDYAHADQARGGELFRINCSQCHQAAGQGGALTQGKYAPNLMGAEPKEIYEAMITGPQSMPVFSDAQIPTENKKEIIAYVTALQEDPSPGGLTLGKLGPVTEAAFLATAVVAVLITMAVWIGIKAR